MLLEERFTVTAYFWSISILLGLVMWVLIQNRIQNRKVNKFAFIDEILLLTSYVVMIDGGQNEKEITFVKRFLIKEYDEETAIKYVNMLTPLLKKSPSIKPALLRLNFNETESTLVHLLNFLIKITIVDGFLSEKEYKGLLNICQGLGLPRIRLDGMLAMYNYVKEGSEKQEQKKKKNSTNRIIKSKLNQAYLILELIESASEKEIKKSYRKLVILYHPDKLLDLDEKFRKGAKEKFQKLNDAYDLIKEKRGIK